MNGNQFELTGRINYIDFKALESGTTMVRTLMSKKGRNEGEYETYPIVFFKEIADKFFSAVVKGDTVNVTGRLTYQKYKTKDGKQREDIGLLGNTFTKVKYDESKKQYVAVDNESNNEIPW